MLVKANKLYPSDLEIVESRFEIIRRSIQAKSVLRRYNLAIAGSPQRDQAIAEEEALLSSQLQELDSFQQFVHASNRPTVLAEGSFQRLNEIAARTFEDSRGQQHPFLTSREVTLLSIRKGSLSEEERDEIESHVTHTYNFLSQIPWTRALKNVPDIAYGHHEKLTGRGYPRSLNEREIPVQTRMMTISDIYDALTASDRPYKSAISHAKAIDILRLEAKDGSLDNELLDVFIEADVPRTARPL